MVSWVQPSARGCHWLWHRLTRSLAVAVLVVMLVMVAFVDPAQHGSRSRAGLPSWSRRSVRWCRRCGTYILVLINIPESHSLFLIGWRCAVSLTVCSSWCAQGWRIDDGVASKFKRRGGGTRTASRRTTHKRIA